MKIKQVLKVIISLILILSNISCDQITKSKVRKEIVTNETIQIVDDNFILTKVENTGVAYSLGSGLPNAFKILFFQLLPIAVLFLMFLYSVRKENTSKLNLIAFSFLIGGGIGNIYDRVAFNSVTDFMYLKLGVFHTAVFNMADVSVCVGALLLILSSVFSNLNKKTNTSLSF